MCLVVVKVTCMEQRDLHSTSGMDSITSILRSFWLFYSWGLHHLQGRNMPPAYIWLAFMSLQAHKEERFLYPIYPLICVAAAAVIDSFPDFFHDRYLSEQSIFEKPNILHVEWIWCSSADLSASRIS